MDQGSSADQSVAKSYASLLTQTSCSVEDIDRDLQDRSCNEEILEITPILLGEAMITKNLDVADDRDRRSIGGDEAS